MKFYVAIIGDDEAVALPGTLVESPEGFVHGLQNCSDEIAKVLVIKPENQ